MRGSVSTDVCISDYMKMLQKQFILNDVKWDVEGWIEGFGIKVIILEHKFLFEVNFFSRKHY
jgi:hypothetical protein